MLSPEKKVIHLLCADFAISVLKINRTIISVWCLSSFVFEIHQNQM